MCYLYCPSCGKQELLELSDDFHFVCLMCLDIHQIVYQHKAGKAFVGAKVAQVQEAIEQIQLFIGDCKQLENGGAH